MYKIVAQRGDQYLLVPVEGFDPADLRPLARILDMDRKKLYPPLRFQSILATGYWEDYNGDETAEELIAQVQDVGSS